MGGRSAKAQDFLKTVGFTDVLNLKGGILEWIDKVDPSQPEVLSWQLAGPALAGPPGPPEAGPHDQRPELRPILTDFARAIELRL